MSKKISKFRWTSDLIRAEALKYSGRKKFAMGSPSAYQAANRLGIMDVICSHMSTEGSTKQKKFSEVVEVFESNNYKLTNQIYYNTNQKLNSICPDGHLYQVSYELFANRGYRCAECSGNRKKTIEEVKKIFTDRNYTPMFSEYHKNISPLSVQCPQGHGWSVSVNNFNKGVECPICTRGRSHKFSYNDVRDYFSEHGYTLISSEYANANTPLLTICSKGHEHSIRFGDFRYGYRCGACVPRHTSKAEKEILEWVKTYYPSSKKKRAKDRKNNRMVELDIFVPELNLAIEYNGVYWHSEQHKHKNYHFEKMLFCNEKGIRLITIFEDEWINRKEQVKNFLLSILNKNKSIYARSTKTEIITSNEAKIFLHNNHIQGSATCSIAVGLFYNSELVGVMTGNKHHRANYDASTLVLNRLAFSSQISVVGGASKLLSKLKIEAKKLGYSKIISWSDNRWSEGNVYRKMGFSLEEELTPDYSYVSNGTRLSKQSNTKTSLLKKGAVGTTEREMALSLGLKRIWDCGKKRWATSL